MISMKNHKNIIAKTSLNTIFVIFATVTPLILASCATTNQKPRAYNYSKQDRAVNYVVSNLEPLAKSLPEETIRASAIDVNSFKELTKIYHDFDYYLDQLQNGNTNIDLSPMEDKDELLAINKLWSVLRKDVASILKAEGAVRMTSEFVDAIVETTPELLKIANEVLDDIKYVDEAGAQINIARQQLVLLSRITINSKRLLYSGKETEAKVEKIAEDAASFKLALNALINSSNSLGFNKIEDKEVRSKLSDMKDIFDSLYPIFALLKDKGKTVSNFQSSVINITAKAGNLLGLIKGMKRPVANISVAHKINSISPDANNDTVTLSGVYLQLERMENLLFKCRLFLSDSGVSPEIIDNKASNCVASLGLQLDALQKNKNDVLFIQSTNGRYMVNNMRSEFAKLKKSQGVFSKYLYNKIMAEQDAKKILSVLPYYIDQNLAIGGKAIESGETATNVYVIMRQVYLLQRMEENTQKILNLKSVDSAGPIFDYIGRDAALFVRISDALVNSNAKMNIEAVTSLKLNKELSGLNKKFNNDISSNVGKLLDLTGQYFAYIQAKKDMQKYLDKMIGDVDYLRSKYRQTINSGDLT